jgi:hypothetical protein
MSWFSTHYEKALLGLAAALALGLAYMSWTKLNGVAADFNFNATGHGKNDATVAGAESAPKALQSLKLKHDWTQEPDGDRPVDLFTGVPLFIKRSDPKHGIDLRKGPEVHSGIPNSWWIDNHIDPGFGDAPQRDPDDDGFSNLEEFLAKTDPNSKESHPALISKLQYVRDQSLVWLLRPSFGDGNGGFPFSYTDGKGRKNQIAAGNMVAPGTLFFDADPMRGRFKLLGQVVRQELNPATNATDEVTLARVEDQKPNKKGTIYEIPAPIKHGQDNKYRQFDRSAVISLQALGHQAEEIVVEENTAFSLLASEPKKDYFLKRVSPESITVEYTAADGTRKTVDVAKGGLPKL